MMVDRYAVQGISRLDYRMRYTRQQESGSKHESKPPRHSFTMTEEQSNESVNQELASVSMDSVGMDRIRISFTTSAWMSLRSQVQGK